jgi:hypothetical protein
MHAVLYCRIAMAIKADSKMDAFCINVMLIVVLAATGAIQSK